MKIIGLLTNDAVLAELGARLQRARINLSLTQQALAQEAGVSRLTVEALEHGRSINTGNLLRILRALDMIDALDALAPDTGPGPIELAETQGRGRVRVRASRAARPHNTWTWGDESEPAKPMRRRRMMSDVKPDDDASGKGGRRRSKRKVR
ncbi:MAG: helix-turn-helix transcriptional regulator [Hyphomonadaceae bacterium]|nr:helix-turn-helix transcriptional regulator [Hyphomonadaceae bacterium]